MVDYMVDEEITTIQLKVSTRAKLKKLGKKDETYDDLILKLIDNRKASKFSQ